ncbi:2,3-bisphosphoglycerate-independent phosphoglycerate mutase [Candidatus Berkelbacteria bacterium]|nr:2,3-bisphosphoglycerate-independent phosphoglycerate mutase [Candidatus Berkelbacteria bacterium]
MSAKEKPKAILIILDGFGLSPITKGNAIYQAKTPNLNRILASYPYTALRAHGTEVGLRWAEMGNSEVGHLNIGAGRVVEQDVTKIFHSIDDRKFFDNRPLREACSQAKKSKSTLHLIGLASAGGVHGHIDHLKALLELAHSYRIEHVALHLIADGRDAESKSLAKYLPGIEETRARFGGEYATLIGRYYAMDRDRRWERTQAAYQAMVSGEGQKAATLEEALELAYARKETDEFIRPTVINPAKKELRIQNGDVVIFANYRPDRARQLAAAFRGADFDGFVRKERNIHFVTFTDYGIELKHSVVAFLPEPVPRQLASILASAHLRQLHIGETEKYAHVTYFFNGGVEKPFDGEKRILINSPKVGTYDEAPEMSAREITDSLLTAWSRDSFDVAIVNYANPDMVGHTGDLAATVKALEFLDQCLGKIFELAESQGDCILITSDHGNAEQLLNPMTGDVDKEHTVNPVPLILVAPTVKHRPKGGDVKLELLSQSPVGILADVAPTLLALLDIKRPAEMTGENLLHELR